MLFKDPFIIQPKTFALIQELQTLDFLKEFYLVGGTALALQLGHRNSIDIDFFSQNDFSTQFLINEISKKYEFHISFERENTLLCSINTTKTDFIKHNNPFVKDPITEEGIKFLSKEDIAAMKLNAIVQSGKRLKDFIDIYFLLEHYSVDEMLDFYKQKYPHMNAMIPLKALGFFDDIDPEMDPPKLRKPLPLSKIKKRILDAILHSKKTF
jgi:predicted nucleotidyltransferase component of viral defense system